MKRISKILLYVAWVLSYLMCIDVAYNYGALTHCIACSAPAYVAFFSLIPYAAAIIVCLVISFILKHKSK